MTSRLAERRRAGACATDAIDFALPLGFELATRPRVGVAARGSLRALARAPPAPPRIADQRQRAPLGASNLGDVDGDERDVRVLERRVFDAVVKSLNREPMTRPGRRRAPDGWRRGARGANRAEQTADGRMAARLCRPASRRRRCRSLGEPAQRVGRVAVDHAAASDDQRLRGCRGCSAAARSQQRDASGARRARWSTRAARRARPGKSKASACTSCGRAASPRRSRPATSARASPRAARSGSVRAG